ncbi:MAG: imidazole glycerol phosphate synthase subunit HisH [Planctomycetes bacterium]|nr:imidazole glycerol phosphate synthase subunit HisH [Planctomycetota bacterium]MBL7152996.1 imidazole glycerol phosphate synthase subunit HisH [Phycisphaerae bacterium]
MIVVIDYNVGNVKSVCNAFRYIGCDVELSCEPEAIRDAWGLVLPGVAAFGYAVRALGPAAELIKEAALGGKPLLGICVGFQMLFETSSEYGVHDGLGLVGGTVGPIPAGRVIPHTGWNLVDLPGDMDLFVGLGDARHFYFAHSYCARVSDEEAKVACADYGFELAASVQKDNIYGTQFHPEKSGKWGLEVLRNFYDICEKSCGH